MLEPKESIFLPWGMEINAFWGQGAEISGLLAMVFCIIALFNTVFFFEILAQRRAFLPMITFELQPGREKSLLRRHPWIFSKAIAAVKDSETNELLDKSKVKSGTLCKVVSSTEQFLCYAHYSPSSQIVLRAISFKEEDVIDYNFVKQRLQEAIARRAPLVARNDHGIRLVAAEGDFMPGLVVDKFNNVICAALSSAGMESLYEHIFKALHELNPDCYLYERSDAKSRRKENLPLRAGLIDPRNLSKAYNLKDGQGNALQDSKQITQVQRIGAAEGELIALDEAIPDTLFVLERGLVEIPIDVKKGHKTGGYLDQRQSRYHTYELCQTFKALSEDGKTGPSVLNCFSYTGGFGLLALKGGAKAVYNIDVSENALNAAREGVVHNHLDPGRCKFIKQDVFEYLRREVAKGTKFDIVILDPPKFAESKSNLASACRGYQDINRLGLQLVRPGGRLLTFSCSGLMTEYLFQKIIADAALDAKVEAQIITTLRQDIDHIVALPCPETFYLKGFEILVN